VLYFVIKILGMEESDYILSLGSWAWKSRIMAFHWQKGWMTGGIRRIRSDFYKQQFELLFKNLSRGNMKPRGCQLKLDHTFLQYPGLLVIYFIIRKDAYFKILLHRVHFMLDPRYHIKYTNVVIMHSDSYMQ
jgi:hypothetical protein